MMNFEDLPNELFLEIFQYLNIDELLESFWNLTQRINQSIQSAQDLSYNFQKQNSLICSRFSHQITRLIINTNDEIDFQQFPFLISLTLQQITFKHLQQIQSNILPNLVHLSIAFTKHSNLFMEFLIRIFSNSIPTLRYLELGYIHLSNNLNCLSSNSLTHISIHCNNLITIPCILILCSNLLNFQVQFLSNTSPSFHSYPKIVHNRLKSFQLIDSYHQLIYNNIHTILTFMPNLRKLYLNILIRIPIIRLIRSLSSRLKYLKEFHCDIDDVSPEPLATIDDIRNIRSCFSNIICSIDESNFRTYTTSLNPVDFNRSFTHSKA